MARIAHFIDTTHLGGAERVVVDLCARLPQLGHSVELHHFRNRWIEDQARTLGVACVRLPRERWYRSKWSVGGFAVGYAKLLRQRGIEILHSHLVGPISAGAAAATMAGIPHVGTLHDVHLVQAYPRQLRLLRLAAALGTQLVAVSEDMRRFYQGAARGAMSLELVYNGVEVSNFGFSRERSQGPYTFVTTGRLVAIKGYDVMLRALALTGDEGARLRILGDGQEREALQAQATALGITQRVEFLGFRTDVAALLAEADAFVLASHSEGMSCSLVEAMASGLPCVVTDVGGNRELVLEGVNGFCVRANDPAALAERMMRLAKDRALSRQLGAASRERAQRCFSLEASVRGYDGIYRSLLPPPLRRAGGA